MRPEQTKSVILQHSRHAGEQMIVAAIEMTDGARKHAQGREIELNQLTQAGPHQRSDEDHVAATFAARQTQKPAKLRDMRPMMRIILDALGIRPSTQRKQHRLRGPF